MIFRKLSLYEVGLSPNTMFNN